MLTQKQVQEEKKMFSYDLALYTRSEQGKALKEAFAGGNVETIEKALDNYYSARNRNTFTYESEEARQEAMELDKMLADYYHCID